MTGFTSSGSINSDLAERNRRSRAPLMRRLLVIGWNEGVLGHVLYMIFVVAAVASSVGQAFSTSTPNSSSEEEEGRWIYYILTHAGWPPLTWIWMTCLSACAVPVLYMFRPPSVPDREKLLVRCPDTGVGYPKKEGENEGEAGADADAGRSPSYWSAVACLQEFAYVLVTVYTTAMFVGSWVK